MGVSQTSPACPILIHQDTLDQQCAQDTGETSTADPTLDPSSEDMRCPGDSGQDRGLLEFALCPEVMLSTERKLALYSEKAGRSF